MSRKEVYLFFKQIETPTSNFEKIKWVSVHDQTKEMKIKKIVDKTILTKTDGTNKITIKNYIKFFNSDKIKDIELFTSLVDNKHNYL